MIIYQLVEGEGRVSGEEATFYLITEKEFEHARPGDFRIGEPVGDPPIFPVWRNILNEKPELVSYGSTPAKASRNAHKEAVKYLTERVREEREKV